MRVIPILIEASKLAIAAIILFYVVEMISTMPQNIRRIVQALIVLVAILAVLGLAVGEPVRPLPPPLTPGVAR